MKKKKRRGTNGEMIEGSRTDLWPTSTRGRLRGSAHFTSFSCEGLVVGMVNDLTVVPR